MKKIILHLCADIGSDSIFYQNDTSYEVIRIGKEMGVENYDPPPNVYGIIANPVCTEFSTVGGFDQVKDLDKGMILVDHCLRIIDKVAPHFWVLENPANGRLKDIIGKPKHTYQPWQFGSPWTKKTALWGYFNMPEPIFKRWEHVPKIPELYVRPGRSKPGLAYLHKSSVNLIPEMRWAIDKVKCDADIRSMCSYRFAEEFYKCNK